LNVTILGVDHELQRNDRTGDFGKLICRLLDQASIDLIAEEAKETDCTGAQQISSDRSILWLPVDATLLERSRLGIADQLLNRPMPLIFEGDMIVGQKSQYLPHADGIREELWVSRMLEKNVDHALVICGLLHMQSLADKLAARGCSISLINVCETDWYEANYGKVVPLCDSDGKLWYEYRYKTPVRIFPR